MLFAGLSGYSWQKPNLPLTLGTDLTRYALLSVGVLLLIVSFWGMLAMTEESPWMTKLVQWAMNLMFSMAI